MAVFARPSASAAARSAVLPFLLGSLEPGGAFHRQGAEIRSRDEAIRYKGRQVTRQDRAMATSHGGVGLSEGQGAFERVARSGSVWVETREPRTQADGPVLLRLPAPTGSGPM